jgi:hypothetical protein
MGFKMKFMSKFRAASPMGFAFTLLTPLMASALPTEDMGPRSLGVGYQFLARGQNITESKIPAQEIMHSLELNYAPIEYVAVGIGLGLTQWSTERFESHRFQGNYGFSPSAHVDGYSPFLAKVLRVTGGYEGQYYTSRNDAGYRYTNLVHSPYLGLSVTPLVFLETSVGVRGHFIMGSRKPSSTAEATEYANVEPVRAYFSLTIKTPFENAFLTLDADASPELETDWSNGPQEASVGLTFGGFLKWKGQTPKANPDRKNPYFPAHGTLKKRQEQMVEDLR